MRHAPADPGYGSVAAPVGTPEWAKRWRLEFQGVAKNLPQEPARAKRFYDTGVTHRAWTLLTDADGKAFRDFDSFCACRQPWGLGMDPAMFKAYLEVRDGKRAVALHTVPSERQGERADLPDTSCVKRKKSDVERDARLRAILRAPELVQDLYREGRIAQTVAARLGPKSPTPEQAAKVAEARQAIESLDRAMGPAEFRQRVARVVAEAIGKRGPTRLDRLRKLWADATDDEKAQFRREIG